MSILFFFIIISLLVFVHEWGHFIAARRVGVAVDEFGFGFPPRLWSVRRGQTRWSINLIPFGGFVKLQGEQDDAMVRPDSFVSAGYRKKFLILAAGVVMNYLLAWVLLSGALVSGVMASEDARPTDRWHRFTSPRHTLTVSADSSAAQAGLQNGDQLLTVNGQTITNTTVLIDYVQTNAFPPLHISYVRQGRSSLAVIQPQQPDGDAPRYGLGIDTVGILSYPWYVAPWYGFSSALNIASQTFVGLGQLVTTLVTERRLSADVTGPVGIAVLTNQITRLGFIPLVQFTAIISISLAVLNFLPIPALDGGRAVFVAIEAVRKRPVNRRIEAIVHTASFYALLILIVMISIRDVSRFDLLNRLRHILS